VAGTPARASHKSHHYFARPFLDAIDCTQCVIPPAKRRSVYGSAGLPASCAGGADISFVETEAFSFEAAVGLPRCLNGFGRSKWIGWQFRSQGRLCCSDT